MKRVLLSWSSGKDSAWALHLLRQNSDVEVVAMVTTFNTEADRVAMHSTRRALVRKQAERIGLPLWEIELPAPCSNDEYEKRMEAVWKRAKAEGIEAVAFGDLFLEDIRAYRIKQLANTGLKPLFPVWGIPTDKLAREMIEGGLKTKIVCVNPKVLSKEFAGRDFDLKLLSDLPKEIDPCGENGEFHTFVYEAPIFSKPIRVKNGEVVGRSGFVFADVIERQ